MTVPQQGSQILQLLRRQPDRRKAVFYQQLQNQVRISPIMFLLPGLGGPNLCRRTDQAFDSQLFQEGHEPLHRSRGFDPHTHRAWKLGNNVREFYAKLPRPVRGGIEATGSMQWFVNLLEELGIECLVGPPAEIRAAEPRKQKHDRRDADLILKLLVENRFPAIWLPSKELQDLRALLRHRHQWVRMRTRIQNALQSIALANGLRRGTALWSHDGQSGIASLPLAPHTAYRRSELQAMYEKFEAEIEKLNQRVEEQACKRPGARLLMSHPGVGPITALATEVFLGDPTRFADSKALASYVGMI